MSILRGLLTTNIKDALVHFLTPTGDTSASFFDRLWPAIVVAAIICAIMYVVVWFFAALHDALGTSGTVSLFLGSLSIALVILLIIDTSSMILFWIAGWAVVFLLQLMISFLLGSKRRREEKEQERLDDEEEDHMLEEVNATIEKKRAEQEDQPHT